MISINSLAERLKQYDIKEACSIVRLLLMDNLNLSFTDICAGALNSLSKEQEDYLMQLMRRLEEGEPVQYVTGFTYFLDNKFTVREGVLIPRPETEELCELIINRHNIISETCQERTIKLLDIGTGSGCIAISLAKNIKDSTVSAWDISEKALCIARGNAKELDANVDFIIQDALSAPKEDKETWDVIVSNPPYICEKEKAEMHKNVLDYEPHIALFVDNNDPLLFYRNIAEYAAHALKKNGSLYFEINPLYAEEMKKMLSSLLFHDIELINDQFGKERMMTAKI